MKRIALSLPLLVVILMLSFSCKKTKTVDQAALTLESGTVSEKHYLNGDSSKQYLDISLDIKFPESFPDETVLKKIRNIVVKDLFPDTDSEYVDVASVMKAYIADYVKFFEVSESESVNQDGEDYQVDNSWWDHEKMIVHLNDDHLFSYTIFSDRYSGGAHGGKNFLNTVIDLKTGEKVSEDDLFSETTKPIIASMIVGKILQKNNITKAEELEDIGYFDVSEINLNKNFYITDKGLVYTFNEYEIAAYAVGTTEVLLDFPSIASFLNPESPVAYLLI